jgi:hypothetical protein
MKNKYGEAGVICAALLSDSVLCIINRRNIIERIINKKGFGSRSLSASSEVKSRFSQNFRE